MTNKQFRDAFAAVLNREITSRRITAGSLAKKMGISRAAMGYFLHAVNSPKGYVIYAAIKALGMGFDEFYADIEREVSRQ